MRSLLYEKMLFDEKSFRRRDLESLWIDSALFFLEPELAKERMITLKKHLIENGSELAEHINDYESFAEMGNGNLWLENQKNGTVKLFILRKGYHKDFWESEFASVEAAVFAVLLKYAETYIAELGIEYDEMRYEFKDAVDKIADLLPVEWSTELYAIAEKPFEKCCSLLTPEQLKQLIDKYSLINSDLS